MRALSKVKLLRPPTSDAQLQPMREVVKGEAKDRPGVYRFVLTGATFQVLAAREWLHITSITVNLVGVADG